MTNQAIGGEVSENIIPYRTIDGGYSLEWSVLMVNKEHYHGNECP
ncbi:hypothetical protein YPPY66_3958 [Yersinia pestis PY-66]|uniref:Uncharacterized protein n=3 Tax=Yersinia pseudotuberculosis complex TaxID=1649845 RepID=A0A0U1QZD9_YERP3|nr:hypothetical protein YpsIP31758_3130 [Yersinia pseudotuberculosis IP 31758]ABX84967.1 hypothetical protein YpAngola_A3391 [Yersinia pestis Angola]ADV99953.1 hypothetical protein YPC_3484 [Yersinia pestis biovar Medievalis str. Harbin 35]EDR34640.1 hypothetical protein YPIP275_3653 [Yersinia pestis biovar Orientalis str. IP275]EDR38765.1 hypothetical protein YpF1991016_3199 [Yersinia pestis biovar Orientalis str. F1991016]EDR42367.1 hypothetical protein YpE1979001_0092 [Yersinia pestis biova